MKKIILLSALALSSTIAFAQSENKPMTKEEHHAKMQEHKEKIANELNLTDEQKVKLEAAMEKYKSDKKESHEAKKAAMKEILTPEQQVKMKEMRQAKMKHHKEMKKEM